MWGESIKRSSQDFPAKLPDGFGLKVSGPAQIHAAPSLGSSPRVRQGFLSHDLVFRETLEILVLVPAPVRHAYQEN